MFIIHEGKNKYKMMFYTYKVFSLVANNTCRVLKVRTPAMIAERSRHLL